MKWLSSLLVKALEQDAASQRLLQGFMKKARADLSKETSVLIDKCADMLVEVGDMVRASSTFAVRDLKSETLTPIVGTVYTIFDSSSPGFFGGNLSLKNMVMGDGIEMSVYLKAAGGLERDKVVRVEGLLEEPLVRLDELYSHEGVQILFTQTHGASKPFRYQFYRR